TCHSEERSDEESHTAEQFLAQNGLSSSGTFPRRPAGMLWRAHNAIFISPFKSARSGGDAAG
ncbi:MAG: hypothetical protein WBL25_17535, partial [Anaerolineales bacterium]